MNVSHRQARYLWDILNYCREIRTQLEGFTFEQYPLDRKGQLALERCLEIIGEAAGRLDAATVSQIPNLPVKNMRAMRNVLIHAYAQGDNRKVWEAAINDVPQVVEILTRLEPELSKLVLDEDS